MIGFCVPALTCTVCPPGSPSFTAGFLLFRTGLCRRPGWTGSKQRLGQQNFPGVENWPDQERQEARRRTEAGFLSCFFKGEAVRRPRLPVALLYRASGQKPGVSALPRGSPAMHRLARFCKTGKDLAPLFLAPHRGNEPLVSHPFGQFRPLLSRPSRHDLPGCR